MANGEWRIANGEWRMRVSNATQNVLRSETSSLFEKRNQLA